MLQRIVLVAVLTVVPLLACGGKKSPNGPEGTTVISVLSESTNSSTRAAKPTLSSAEWLTKNEAVVHFQVTQSGHAFFPPPQVHEITYQLKLQQAISGLANPPSFSVEVNTDGLAVIRMIGKHGRGVSGYYRIFFVREVSGAVPDTLGRWGSVPINGGKESNILLPLEQQAVILGGTKPGIDIVSPNGRYSVGALVNITWSVYGFVSEDTRVRIDLYLGDKITWVKNLATNHLIQLGITFGTIDLEPNRVYVVKISTLAPPLVEAWSRDFDVVQEASVSPVSKLKIKLDASTPVSTKLKMGVPNQLVTVLRVINLSERDMPLNGSGLRLYGDIPLKGVNKVTVWDGTIKVGEYVFPYNDRYSLGRFFQSLWIPGSGIKLLAVKVDLAPVNSVTVRDFNGTTLAVNYDSRNPDNTWGVDPVSGQVIYADGSDYTHAPKHTVVAE